MWKTIRQYSKQYDITVQAVRKKIKKGQIENKKVKGIYYVFDVNDDDQVKQVNPQTTDEDEKYNIAIRTKAELENKLRQQKLKNLKQDTLLKAQKNRDVIQKYRREFAQGVFECFTNSFVDVKNFFIELKLNKQQNQKLKQLFQKNIALFRQNLIKYLQQNQNQQDKQNEVN